VRFAVPGRYLPELTYTGATYDVDASLARGWVDELVEANALTERARAAAQEMARLSPKAFTQATCSISSDLMVALTPLYGKGGGAWVGTSSPGLTVNGAPASFTTSNNNNFGWTAGIGVEWAFAGNWSARAEWDVVGLQTQSFTVSGTAFGTDLITVDNRSINMFTTGLNYKFGGWWGY
jgi:opacity protein-like surface antigen